MRHEETRGDWYLHRKRTSAHTDHEYDKYTDGKSKGEGFKGKEKSSDKLKGETSKKKNRRTFNDDFAREIIYDRKKS